MSADHPVGTVAVATVRGEEGVRVMSTESRGFYEWRSAVSASGFVLHRPGSVTDIRPLVVLDLIGDYGPIALAVESLRKDASGVSDYVADQIEAQTKPPRIPEPGLWGVVETDGIQWARFSTNGRHDWVSNFGDIEHWENLSNPTLVREGVES